MTFRTHAIYRLYFYNAFAPSQLGYAGTLAYVCSPTVSTDVLR